MARMTRESIVLFLAALAIGLIIGWGLGYAVPNERPSILTEEEVRQTVRESCSQNLRVDPETIEFLSLHLIDEQAWLVEYRCLPPPWPNGDDLPSLGPWFIRVVIDAQTGVILDEMRIYAQWLYVSVVPDSLSIERTSFHYAVILTNPNDATVTFYLPVFTATLNRIRVPLEIYQWKIWLNMTDPTTLGPHEERTVYDGVIALERALNETCWLEAVAEPDWADSVVPEGWPTERIVFQPLGTLVALDTSEDAGSPGERYARLSYLERDWIVDEVVRRLRVEGYYRKIVGFGYGKNGFAVDFEDEADPRVLAIITEVIDDLPLEVHENAEVVVLNAENRQEA